MYNMSYTRHEVGTAEFRAAVSADKLRRLLAEHPVVEVGSYRNEPAAVVVDPSVFAKLWDDHDRLEQLRSLLPLLAAALASGAALPSEALERFGVDLPDDTWQTLNELQRRLPVHLARGADGGPIARGRITTTGRVDELDEDLVLLDD